MTTQEALLAAIWAEPHDDVVRLAYADWLEETSVPSNIARAQFIRSQIERDQLNDIDPRYALLEQHELALLREYGNEWVLRQLDKRYHALAYSICTNEYAYNECRWVRGFPRLSVAEIEFEAMLKLSKQFFDQAPLWRYHYGNYSLTRLVKWKHAARLDRLAIRSPYLKNKHWVAPTLASEKLRNVRDWHIFDHAFTAVEWKCLLKRWNQVPPSHLGLYGCELEMQYVVDLFTNTNTHHLRGLNLRSNARIGSVIGELLRDGSLPRLRSLEVSDNGLTTQQVMALLQSPQLNTLRILSLNRNPIGDELSERIGSCEHLRNLQVLDLIDCEIDDDGAMELAQSPHLDSVQRIELRGNPLVRSRTAVAALRERFGDRVQLG